jgi:Tfp pilus assembly protein PilX
MNTRELLAPRAKHAEEDNGFTLIEVMVALMVVMLAAVALALVMTNAVTAVSVGRQSQAASNLAVSVVAEAEALPWATLEEGLTSTDPTLVADEKSGGNVGQATGGGNYYCYEGLPLFVTGAGNVASASSAPRCPSSGQQGGAGWSWHNPSWSTGTCYQGLAAEIAAVSPADVPIASHAICVTENHTNYTVVVYPTVASGSSYPPTEIQVSVVVTWSAGSNPVTGLTRVTNAVLITQCRVSGTPPTGGGTATACTS